MPILKPASKEELARRVSTPAPAPKAKPAVKKTKKSDSKE